ncbi:MAG: hypothetical protein RIC35_00070 [Marinoscillum sp.]
MSTINKMPDHARIWVYQSTRVFTPEEEAFISEQLTHFTNQWAAHGQQLAATFSIELDQFIVLAVDESMHQASGCSIDASVHVIKHIEQHTGLTLLDRSKVAYMDGEQVGVQPFNAMKKAIAEGIIKKDTIIFNNAIQNTGEWKSNWKQAASESWLKRFFV